MFKKRNDTGCQDLKFENVLVILSHSILKEFKISTVDYCPATKGFSIIKACTCSLTPCIIKMIKNPTSNPIVFEFCLDNFT